MDIQYSHGNNFQTDSVNKVCKSTKIEPMSSTFKNKQNLCTLFYESFNYNKNLTVKKKIKNPVIKNKQAT